MTRSGYAATLYLSLLLAATAAPAQARQTTAPTGPAIGYVYPAGAQRGTTTQVVVGGQRLSGVKEVVVTGDGLTARVVAYKRPLSTKEYNIIRDKVTQAQEQVREERQKKGAAPKQETRAHFMRVVAELGVTPEQLAAAEEFRRQRSDPKRQDNPQLAEMVELEVEVASDATPGLRELRLVTPGGLTSPLRFMVAEFNELREVEPNDQDTEAMASAELPVVLNGQVLPGDVDRFAFAAKKGTQVALRVQARTLMPYLADAVPGWFQATLRVQDDQGREVAYGDDFFFHPDPLVICAIPADGIYTVEIKDSIFRGREDFVYRIAVGELPCVSSVFPLGSRGETTPVALRGWNLPVTEAVVTLNDNTPGIHPASLDLGGHVTPVLFAVDPLPTQLETAADDGKPQRVTPPLVIDGRIETAGDRDTYTFEGKKGQAVVAEVLARRLNSPLDSQLVLLDRTGALVASNDDHDDPGSGLLTHHADSFLSVTLPADGTYALAITDAQNHGSLDHGYRLRISAPQPDFELRITPSCINARAGTVVPITVHALRRDGFDGDIALELKNPPEGFSLDGAWVPGGQEIARLTLNTPLRPPAGPTRLQLVGKAQIDGATVVHLATPADTMMQAFFYHHLVPAREWLALVSGSQRTASVRSLADGPVSIPINGTAEVPFAVYNPAAVAQLILELSQPPAGVTIDSVKPGNRQVSVVLRASGEAQAGFKGNLIVDVFAERNVRSTSGTKKEELRRVTVGTLPAISFVIAEQN